MRRGVLIALVGASVLWATAGCGGSGDSSSSGGNSSGTASGGGTAGNGQGGGTNTGGSNNTGSSSSGSGQGGMGTGGSGQGGMGTGGSGQGGMGTGGSGQGGNNIICNDGDTQACYNGPMGTQGVGACVAGTQTCANNAWGACVGEVMPGNEVCDAVDNDCNGQTDEGFGSDTCGQGACQVTVQLCVNGVPQQCMPLPPQVNQDACGGMDDNCDGVVNGGCSCVNGDTTPCYTGPMGTQGVGVCKPGTQTCVMGSWGACAGDTTPSAETCDGLDNNCSGSIDEGFAPLNCGVGACQASTAACINGVPQQCVPGQPSAETCDGIDNNCNGQVDDGFAPISCGVGQCANTVPACVNGQPNVCNPKQPQSEVCDGLDNDCNGTADNGNPGGGVQCPTGLPGLCGPGVTACTNGSIVCNQTIFPTSETCDGLDNNCNGFADEGSPGSGQACSTGLQGVCMAGTTACTNGSLACNQNTASSAEMCDGLDNDCDGVVDDGNPGSGVDCITGLQGLCGLGKTTCQNGQLACVQQFFPSAETCDGLDNNCDGAIDENNPGGGGNCSTGQPGICNSGTNFCLNAQIVCIQNQSPQATDICGNGVDDNCNGQTDENIDADGDGWGTCQGDCCDAAGACSNTPALVNPGAYEVLNNSINDDCDAATSDTVAPADCSPPPLQTPTTATKLAQAMDICNFTTANPPLPQKKWGIISAVLTSANGLAGAPSDIQVGVLNNYGNILPKKGGTFASISSGTARDQGDAGYVIPHGNGWNLGTTSVPPAVYLNAHGGQLQTAPGCTTANDANDSANLKLQIRVPTNAKSFSYQFRFFSAEYPEWVCDLYNDFYLALLTSNAAGIPADHNISFDTNNNPVSVNVGFFDVCQGCPAGTNDLINTGMGGTNGALNDGGGTVWLTTTSPIVSGENMTIEFMIWDTGDHLWDSAAILDNFKWDVNTATVGTVGGQ